MASKSKRALRSVFPTYKRLEQKDIMLMYRGKISADLTANILQMAEAKMEAELENRKVKKKFFQVLVECLQNVHLHLEEAGNMAIDLDIPLAEGIIIISQTDSHYHVVTGNYIQASKVAGLRKKIMRVNRLDSFELKELYKKTLNNDTFSDKGTAGLGLIDIARKSQEKIWFHFDQDQDHEDFSFFSMESRVPRAIAVEAEKPALATIGG